MIPNKRKNNDDEQEADAGRNHIKAKMKIFDEQNERNERNEWNE